MLNQAEIVALTVAALILALGLSGLACFLWASRWRSRRSKMGIKETLHILEDVLPTNSLYNSVALSSSRPQIVPMT